MRKVFTFGIYLVLFCLVWFLNTTSSHLPNPNTQYKYFLSAGSDIPRPPIDSYPRPPVHWNSSWLGKHWIPNPDAGYRLYTPVEISHYFRKHSVLVIGDSTARRQFATWYGIINASNFNDLTLVQLDSEGVIDVNKKAKTEKSKDGFTLSRHMPGTNNSCDLYSQVCLSGLVNDLKPNSFLEQQLGLYSLVLFVLGPWEYDGKLFECFSREHGRRNTTKAILQRLIEISHNYPGIKFVWRTWAGPAERIESWKNAQAHNHYVKTLIHNFQRERFAANDKAWAQISYVDWGQVMGPRVFPNEQRISGDIPNHFGFEARSAFVQMWINHLIELDRQEELNLAPGWSMWNTTDSANDCLHAGGSTKYCLSQEELDSHYKSFLTISEPLPELNETEQAEYSRVMANFCWNCTSSTWGIPCEMRMINIRGRYKLDERSALLKTAKDDPKCNKNQTETN